MRVSVLLLWLLCLASTSNFANAQEVVCPEEDVCQRRLLFRNRYTLHTFSPVDGTCLELCTPYTTLVSLIGYTCGACPPTVAPTVSPSTAMPTMKPTATETLQPTTQTPTRQPSTLPSTRPTYRGPTMQPTGPTRQPQPTHQPTKNPAEQSLAPTGPTLQPSNPPDPSLSPTGPTLQPTHQPTNDPLEQSLAPTGPTTQPTDQPTNDPAKQSLAPTAPTLQPTDRTFSPTTSPAPFALPDVAPTHRPSPIVEPTISPASAATGQVCARDADCVSDACRNGACVATAECSPLRHLPGTPFDANRINLVFVASQFDTSSDEFWQDQVDRVFAVFGNYNMFTDTALVNAFRVETREPSFCEFNCGGIARLLCCDNTKAHELTRKCLAPSANVQTIVIHKDETYGGAGYRYTNIGTTSIHPNSPLVAVHELGHSLFELADEYDYGSGTSFSANCDASRSCTKWNDLIGNTPAMYNPVSCVPACRENDYYAGELSFMQSLSRPVGAVNERFTCCTFQALTKTMPDYCRVFDHVASRDGDTYDYCKDNDYQRYGRDNYDLRVGPPDGSGDRVDRDPNARYRQLFQAPILVTIDLSDDNEPLVMQREVGNPGLYRIRLIKGDFDSLVEASASDLPYVVQVTMQYEDSSQETRWWSPYLDVSVPLLPSSNVFAHNDEEEEMRRVETRADVLQVVIPGDRVLNQVQVAYVDL